MRRLIRLVIALGLLSPIAALALGERLLAGGGHELAQRGGVAVVARVYDGDTLTLVGGARVRLIQIDAPELRQRECYGRASARELRRLLPVGTRVRLERDALLDAEDRYGRLLRYVVKDKANVNVALVRRGAAAVWFYVGDRGRYAPTLLRAQRLALRERRGMWSACRVTWSPTKAVETSPR